MAQLLNVTEDGTVIMDKVALKYTSGSVIHSGSIEVINSVQIDNNLVVAGTITADTFNVKNLVTENGSLDSVGQWIYNTEAELNGKGFSWSFGTGQTQLVYRSGGRIWANASFDMSAGGSYRIDNIPVLTGDSLGPTITSSSLTTVGTLNSLAVSGTSTFAEFVYIDSDSNRIGIGTDEPNSSLSILDNNVELTIGSPRISLGAIGTHSSHDLAIVTDNIPRITVKNMGEVQIGNSQSNGAVLRVYGTIYADRIESASSTGRPTSVEFKATDEASIFGTGVVWTSGTISHQLVMMDHPRRLWTTENFDLAQDRSYYINGELALSAGTLGSSITISNLTKLGMLSDLHVGGPAVVKSITADSLTVDNTVYGSGGFSYDGHPVITAYGNQTIIGNMEVQTTPVKVFGPLSVNVNNPEPGVQFSVNGDVNIGGKKFTSGVGIPSQGTFTQGDICWNIGPQPGGYVGWICTSSGTPGAWAPFGLIASQ